MIARTASVSVLLALTACAVAIVGVAAVWAGVSLIFRDPCAWMALIAALDAALLLRLAGWRPGRARAALATGVTVLTIVVAHQFVAAAQIGLAMGLRPFEAATRMSLELGWLYAQSSHGPFEWCCYAIAIVAAGWLGR